MTKPLGKSKVVSNDIGTTGNVGGNKSKGGGQYPFLPGADSYKGGKGNAPTGGASEGTTSTDIPFLPKGGPSGLKRGKH